LKFTRLRLTGFKSFVEPTELIIEPGLTAIVGPNGCGKSNLFDALRWVMGETRPTSVRGAEMDDVIFAGSAARPARNMAEVVLSIDNTDRSVGAPYADYETLDVSRRIEREAGSVYRINGRDVRQRDVQLFFADASSGAASAAFVRQGLIGQLISQKPLARRAILEEAAGISGLHQRRHEAELRLRAAETNLSRLDDVVREIEGQLQNLKRQARQASRYRNLSGHIRRAEALAHYLRWTAAEERAVIAKQALAAAEAIVETATSDAARASTAQAEVAALLPPLRQSETEKAAALHRLVVQRDQLEAEEARAHALAQTLRQRIAQTLADLERESVLAGDAQTALDALAKEADELDAAQERAGEDFAGAQARAGELHAALADVEARLEKLTAELAEYNARKASLEQTRRTAGELAEITTAQLAEAQARLDMAMANAASAPDVTAAELAAAEAHRLAEIATAAAGEAREAFTAAVRAEAETRGPLEETEREVQRLSAEAKALADLLQPETQNLWPPLIDAVRVQPGYEAALAAALGDTLQAPLDEAAPHHWRDLGRYDATPPLPVGAKPLSDFVTGPDVLTRRLSMTGVVFPDQGIGMQRELLPGQRLVSPRGDLWRWDGYRASCDAPSAAAVRLAQHNKLATLEESISAAKEKRAAAFAIYSSAKTAAEGAHETLRAAETEERRHGHAIIAAQDGATKAARAAAERASKLASLEAEIRRLTEARETALAAQGQAASGLTELGDGTALVQTVADAREKTGEARIASGDARATVDNLKREGEARTRRLAAIAEERARWQSRHAAAITHIAELESRKDELGAELAIAEAAPEAIAEKRGALLDAIAAAETLRNQASDARAEAETRLAEADKLAKTADQALSAAREERAREDAVREAAMARLIELSTRIRDELDLAPEELAERAEIAADIAADEELPPLEQAEKKVEKLKQEREQLGGVNLRAEEEADELEQRLATLTADRDDLTGAIERLRRGIQSLNREGRERLIASFEKVNANFQMLFTKLFQGGEAKLSFTESDDPLEAGLEIYARPPGKRLQSLGLLSGGEQALTAMALIFAVFLVNPSPVCVLDEVDAPLDDANVERFCDLLDEMTRIAETRFLVITHHALTMSRMHRLFGVTMAERGISQLVSVTLAEAERVAAE
jgi:chromosome segregation protein